MTPQVKRAKGSRYVATWIAYCLTFGAVGTLPVYIGAVFSRPLTLSQVAISVVILVLPPAAVTGICLVLVLRLAKRERGEKRETADHHTIIIIVTSVACGFLVIVWNGICGEVTSHVLWPLGLDYFVAVSIAIFSPLAVLGVFRKLSSALIVISIFALGTATFIFLHPGFSYLG